MYVNILINLKTTTTNPTSPYRTCDGRLPPFTIESFHSSDVTDLLIK
ncbi:hypothetical protein HanPSC8_Chr03g0086661 [Helianthus annuus]|nr:hypothetical protein HanIR_Chr12g0614731 [Helianthus annuus]KAJ0941997.1 hypothetical protein HanPSC8_Chr03g0086661 [Helianthus annuus]